MKKKANAFFFSPSFFISGFSQKIKCIFAGCRKFH